MGIMDTIQNFLAFVRYFFTISFQQVANIMDSTGTDLCLKIWLFLCILIMHISVLYIFIKCLMYTVYFIYYRVTLILRENPSLYHSPYFAQLNDFTYYNKYLAFEKYILTYIILIIIFFCCLLFLYVYTKGLIKNSKGEITSAFSYYTYLIGYAVMVIAISIAFMIMHAVTIVRVSSIINNMLDNLYDNLNLEYLNNVCDYTENKDHSVSFIYGYCNGLESNREKLKTFLGQINTAWSAKHPGYLGIYRGLYNEGRKDEAKEYLMGLKDDDDVSYYGKMLRALVTFSLINYFVQNNLRNEGQRFFSISNTVRENLFDELIKTRINPFLYLKNNNLILINYVFTRSEYVNIIPGDLFDILNNDYDDIKDNITNGIIELYDIFTYKMTPAAYSYILISIVGVALIMMKYFEFTSPSK